mmetsp:Transcript_25207/g.57998  ORF Transcript_25207/g.57998 Transcript_25207/m.57998 type:complete len:211 (-) Transcript_25207:529-1161(-)
MNHFECPSSRRLCSLSHLRSASSDTVHCQDQVTYANGQIILIRIDVPLSHEAFVNVLHRQQSISVSTLKPKTKFQMRLIIRRGQGEIESSMSHCEFPQPAAFRIPLTCFAANDSGQIDHVGGLLHRKDGIPYADALGWICLVPSRYWTALMDPSHNDEVLRRAEDFHTIATRLFFQLYLKLEAARLELDNHLFLVRAHRRGSTPRRGLRL